MRVATSALMETVTRRLVAEFGPEQIWLFGSCARGKAREDSDLDLLVVVPQSDEPPVRRAQRAHECLSGLGIAKDVLVKTRAEWERFRGVPSSLEALIESEGRRIYG
jgi:predicted nucleotidyltransferase